MPSGGSGTTRIVVLVVVAGVLLVAALVLGRGLLSEPAPPPERATPIPEAPRSAPQPVPLPEPLPEPTAEPEPEPPAPRLAHGATLRGRVTSPGGVPLAGATLWLHAAREDQARRDERPPPAIAEPDDTFETQFAIDGLRVEADTEGRYDSGVIESGTWMLAVATPREEWAPTSQTVTLEEGEIRELDLALASPVKLRGRVESEPGTPASGATVLVIEVGLPPIVRRTLYSPADSDGRYVVSVSPSCELLVRALAPSGRDAVSVHAAPGTREVNLTLGQ